MHTHICRYIYSYVLNHKYESVHEKLNTWCMVLNLNDNAAAAAAAAAADAAAAVATVAAATASAAAAVAATAAASSLPLLLLLLLLRSLPSSSQGLCITNIESSSVQIFSCISTLIRQIDKKVVF
jgi:hypothetical protein